MRVWTVAGAVIEAPATSDSESGSARDAVLLVRNLRRNGTMDWTPPGGVIDDGEDLLDGLAREVSEETGLVVTDWAGLLYEIRAEAPELGWDLRVEVHRVAGVSGELSVGEDPDGIVVDAAWAGAPACERLLDDAHPWVREPLVDWMRQRWAQPRSYRYRIDGTSPEDITVVRRG